MQESFTKFRESTDAMFTALSDAYKVQLELQLKLQLDLESKRQKEESKTLCIPFYLRNQHELFQTKSSNATYLADKVIKHVDIKNFEASLKTFDASFKKKARQAKKHGDYFTSLSNPSTKFFYAQGVCQGIAVAAQVFENKQVVQVGLLYLKTSKKTTKCFTRFLKQLKTRNCRVALYLAGGAYSTPRSNRIYQKILTTLAKPEYKHCLIFDKIINPWKLDPRIKPEIITETMRNFKVELTLGISQGDIVVADQSELPKYPGATFGKLPWFEKQVSKPPKKSYPFEENEGVQEPAADSLKPLLE